MIPHCIVLACCGRPSCRAAVPRQALIIASGATAAEPATQGLAATPRAREARVTSFLNAALKPRP